VAFDVGAVTEAPIMIGGQATLELPYRFLVQTELGVLPSFYVNAADSVLVAAGAYDQNVSVLVRNALSNSVVFSLSGGWRPFVDHGFEILGGYTLTDGGGTVSARQAVQAVTGSALPASVPDADIGLHSTVHSVHVSLGWQWVIANHISVRTSLGYLQSVGSSSHITVPASIASNPMVAPHIDQANRAVDAYLNDTFTTYVKLPIVGLSVGYRF
jgi:hypothetical protein